VKRALQIESRPFVYVISDRRALPGTPFKFHIDRLIGFLTRALYDGVDMIQVREGDLHPFKILELCDAVSGIAASMGARALVNDRSDLAAAARIGVHLTTRSIPPQAVRQSFGAEMLIGASTHSVEEAEAAASSGADFVVFGPVFDTPTKRKYGSPVGLQALRNAVSKVGIPVLALGGITLDNFQQALNAGAAGIAGISLFANAEDLGAVIRTIKEGNR
jgi:thiamine-phosphate pyrophosphorylase